MAWRKKRRRSRRNLKRIIFRRAYPTMSYIATVVGLIGLIATVISALP